VWLHHRVGKKKKKKNPSLLCQQMPIGTHYGQNMSIESVNPFFECFRVFTMNPMWGPICPGVCRNIGVGNIKRDEMYKLVFLFSPIFKKVILLVRLAKMEVVPLLRCITMKATHHYHST